MDGKHSWSRNSWAAAEVGSDASSSFLILVLSCKLHKAVPFSRVFSGAPGSSPGMTHVHFRHPSLTRGKLGKHHAARPQMHRHMTHSLLNSTRKACHLSFLDRDHTLMQGTQSNDPGSPSLQGLSLEAYSELFTARTDNIVIFAHSFPQ